MPCQHSYSMPRRPLLGAMCRVLSRVYTSPWVKQLTCAVWRVGMCGLVALGLPTHHILTTSVVRRGGGGGQAGVVVMAVGCKKGIG